jgi:hypothetical protein
MLDNTIDASNISSTPVNGNYNFPSFIPINNSTEPNNIDHNNEKISSSSCNNLSLHDTVTLYNELDEDYKQSLLTQVITMNNSDLIHYLSFPSSKTLIFR